MLMCFTYVLYVLMQTTYRCPLDLTLAALGYPHAAHGIQRYPAREGTSYFSMVSSSRFSLTMDCLRARKREREGENEKEREREKERDREGERESVCACVCVRSYIGLFGVTCSHICLFDNART